MDKYDPKLITPHPWPTPQQLPNGRWMRTFAIRLRDEPILAVTLAELSSLVTEDVVKYMDAQGCVPTLEDDVVISLDLANLVDKRDVQASIMSELDRWDDLLFPVAWRMF